MSNKIITAIKTIDLKNLLSRAGWTFLQAFLAVVLVTAEQLISLAFVGDWQALRVLALASLLGGVAAGLSALKTVLVSVITDVKNKSK